MRPFLFRKKASGNIAKDRLKLLVLSDRLECSPQMMKMLKNDVVHTISKYMTVDEENVVLQITQVPPLLSATIPIHIRSDRMEYSS